MVVLVKTDPWPPRLMWCLNHMTFAASGDMQARGTVVSEAAEIGIGSTTVQGVPGIGASSELDTALLC